MNEGRMAHRSAGGPPRAGTRAPAGCHRPGEKR